MKLRHLALASLALATAHAADDESNLVLLDTVNPAIRDLAVIAGDESTYDSLNEKNKIGVFYSEGLTNEQAGTIYMPPGFNLLKHPNGTWTLADFFDTAAGSIFATNGAIYLSGETDATAPFYQRLPTVALTWNYANNYLGIGGSNIATSEDINSFKSQLLHPTLKTQIYKRFEFSSGLNREVRADDPEYEKDRKTISNTASKLIVVVHGWNTAPDVDPFTSGTWPLLLESINGQMNKLKVFAPGWDLYAYQWGQDSYTGGLGEMLGFDDDGPHANGGVGVGQENGTQAAEIGYQHGLVLGKLISDHCVNNGIQLEKVHFIAHSAGTWVARSASLFLKNEIERQRQASGVLKQQITLLDPYMPYEGYLGWDAVPGFEGGETSVLGKTRVEEWPGTVAPLRCENIFSDDLATFGTNEKFWKNLASTTWQTFANREVGTSKSGLTFGKSDWGGHGGPVNFFAYTVDPDEYLKASGRYRQDATDTWSQETGENRDPAGWDYSLLMKEYRTAKPPAITDVGASVLSTLLSSSARYGPSYAPAASPWKQILVDVDENAWVRAMLMPTNGGAAELAGPVRLNDDGTFTLALSGSRKLTGAFNKSFSPARLSLAVDGVPFGQSTPIAQGAMAHGVDVTTNTAGNVVFSMVLADGKVGLSVRKDDTGTGWAASGTGTTDGSGNFQVTGLANFQVSGQLGEDGSLQTDDITVQPPQVPEIHIVDVGGNPILAGATLLVFPTTRVGATSASQSITVKNTGTVPLTGLTVTLIGTNRTDFRISGWNRSTLAAGSSMTVELLFAPGTSGRKSAAIRIASNDADENPSDIALTGRGSAPEIAIEAPAGKSLTGGKSTVSFKKTRMGSTGSKIKFFIRNTGSAPLKSLSVSNGGKDAKDFIIAQPKLTTVADGANATFTVTFKPKAKGIRNAIIHVRNNDPNENPFDIRLTGEGLATAKPASPLAVAVMEGLMNGEGPLVRRRAPASVIGTIVLRDGRKYLTLAVEKSPGDTNPTVEVSPNLLDWFSGHRHTTILLEDAGLLKVRDNTPVTQDSKRFIRLEPSRN